MNAGEGVQSNPLQCGEPQGRINRAHERFDWNDQCQVCWFPQGTPMEPVSIKCCDLGLGGIGLICETAVAVGTRGAVLLQCDGSSGRIRDIEAVHCRFDPSIGAHIVGAKWLADSGCGDALLVMRTRSGPQLALRPGQIPTAQERGVA